MNRIVIIVFLWISYFASFSQEVKWVSSGAGDKLSYLNGEYDKGYSVIRNDNAIYLSGLITGNKAFIQDTVIYEGDFCFLAKYDTIGNLKWIRKLPGWGRTDITLCQNNDILVTGLTIFDCYIRKYDQNGNLLWDKVLLEDNFFVSFASGAITLDSKDNIYLAGIYYSYYNHFTIGDTLIEGLVGKNHAFILKFNSEGEFKWISTTSGGQQSIYRDIITDENDNVVVIGDFRTYKNDSLLIGNTYLKSLSETITSTPSNDVLCAKFDTEGNFLWMKHFGGVKDDWGNKLSRNTLNDIQIVGTFHNEIDIENLNLVSKGSYDIYISKLNSEGEVLWAESAGGAYGYPGSYGVEAGKSISTDKENNIYISGSFLDTAYFGRGDNETIITTNYPSFTQAGFLAKYSNEGNLIWVKNITGRKSTIEDVFYYKSNITIIGSFFPEGNFLSKPFPISQQLTYNFFIALLNTKSLTIDDPKMVNHTVAYPNPTNGILVINNDFSEIISDIKVYNLYGEEVTGYIYYNKISNSINLSNIENGIYFLQLKTLDGNAIIQKIIKQSN